MERRFDFKGLDPIVHARPRLGVLAALKMDGPLDFTALKIRLEATDGSLGMHLGKLERSGYVTGKTVLIGRRPRTTYRLTAAGRAALTSYLGSMQRLLKALSI